jgi:hypothetical protein
LTKDADVLGKGLGGGYSRGVAKKLVNVLGTNGDVGALYHEGQYLDSVRADPAQVRQLQLAVPFRIFSMKLPRSQLEVRWPLQAESYAFLTFLATPCS